MGFIFNKGSFMRYASNVIDFTVVAITVSTRFASS